MRLLQISSLLVIALIAALASMHASVPTTDAAFSDTDGDGVTDIAEEIFGSDPNAASSTPESGDATIFSPSDVSCSDGNDNDGDGLTDEQDLGCVDTDGSFPSDETELILGTDPEDDDDFPEDSRLGAALAALGYSYLATYYCVNEEDDDLDGLVDAADPGCSPLDADADGFDDFEEKSLGSDWEDVGSRPEHIFINPASCADGSDNDGDTLVDVSDDGCIIAPNDDFADAVIIDSLPFTHRAKLTAATVELGERVSDCRGFVDEEEPRGTVWYTYTPSTNRHVIVDATGSDLLASISVWRFGDAFGLAEVDCTAGSPFFGLSPRFAFQAVAGEEHFIQVERYQALALEDVPTLDLGRLSLHIEETSPLPNDNFPDAQDVTALPFDSSIDTIAASIQAFEPEATCQNGYPANSVWYKYAPTSDTYVSVDAEGSTFSAIFGAYEGTSLDSLQQVACGEKQAFLARAGRTYYLQFVGNQCRSETAGSDGGSSGHSCFESPSGQLQLSIEAIDVPSCPAPQFTLEDPVNDSHSYGGPPPDPSIPGIDISSLSLGMNDIAICVTVDLADAPEDGFLHGWLDIDADLSRETDTGPGVHDPGRCDYYTGLGLDHFVRSPWGPVGILGRVTAFEDGTYRASQSAYFIRGESSATFVLLQSDVGANRNIGFAVELADYDSYDCAPNGGHIACENGSCAFVPFRNGDANCVSGANAIDAAVILQYGAGLLATLSCRDAADVDGNGVIDSRDAALVLQFGAGLLPQLPPAECRAPPEFC